MTKPEAVSTTEGGSARFCCRVTGYPKPRVMWLINGHTVINVRISLCIFECVAFKLPFPSLIHSLTHSLMLPTTELFGSYSMLRIRRSIGPFGLVISLFMAQLILGNCRKLPEKGRKNVLDVLLFTVFFILAVTPTPKFVDRLFYNYREADIS